jgi:cytochrome c-type biogenesis protein CcmE
MDQVTQAAPGKRRAKFGIGVGVIAVALIALTAWAMTREGSTAFYMTPTELQALGSTSESYRVNGDVVKGSVDRDGLTTAFSVTDGETKIQITTDRPLPDAFYSSDPVEVVALGTFDGRVFTASEVLAKCPSKFKAKA